MNTHAESTSTPIVPGDARDARDATTHQPLQSTRPGGPPVPPGAGQSLHPDALREVDHAVATLNALEATLLPLALQGDPLATDRLLAVQRQRSAYLGLHLTDSPAATAPAPVQVHVTVEYVDDWRTA